MVERAVESSTWISVDHWECSQLEYSTTRTVLDSISRRLNRDCKIFFVGGSDLIDSFNVPGLWAEDDLTRLLTHYGVLCIEREGKSGMDSIWGNAFLYRHRHGIHFLPQYIPNSTSSTRIREFVQRGLSLKYLLPDSVIEYIKTHNLYV